MDICIVFGKFAPLHMGHLFLINKAIDKCDFVLVIISYDDKFQYKLNGKFRDILTLENRMRHLKSVYGDEPRVIIDYVDETYLPSYPHGWDEYQNEIKYKCFEHFGYYQPTYIFTSERDYDLKLNEYFPASKHCIVDGNRFNVPISATQIRHHPYEYWEYIPSIIRRDLTLKVCIIGTESSGKTTLCKNLASIYDVDYVEEYGRTFVENDLKGDETALVYSDYDHIVKCHRADIDQMVDKGNILTIIDTNALITGFYQKLYEGSISPVVDEYIKNEKYDLIIYLDDDVPWVDDGMRRSGNKHNETKELLREILSTYNVEYNVVDGDYDTRLSKALNLIKHRIKGID